MSVTGIDFRARGSAPALRSLLTATALLLAMLPLVAQSAPAHAVGENVFISEFHYDNDGADTGEFIEVTGDAGSDLTGWSLELYNGNGGASYGTLNLSGLIADQGGGLGTFSIDAVGLQNGPPDGIALVDDAGTAVEFLSYEGSFTAVGGPADGMTSSDVLVSEPGTTPIGESLQLLSGVWTGPTANTRDLLNDAPPPPPTVFISELHYDNDGTDVGEFVEVEGDAGTDLTGWTIVLYNGSNGTVYDTIILSGIIDDESNGQGALSFLPPAGSIQNGAPDGLALVDAGGGVIEFLSYEGSFTAVGGAADGLVSVDIGVEEGSSTPEGQSLQLINGVWTGPAPESPGDLNIGVTPPANVFISEFHYDNDGTDVGEFVEVEGDAGTDLTGWTIVLYNGSNGTVYDTIILSGIIDDESNGQGALSFLPPAGSIQNGAPDGLALVDAGGGVIEFLSYEGSFTAVGGAADGLVSVDIGVEEGSSTPEGQSLQLINGVWTGPAPESPGDLNSPPVPTVFISEFHYDNDGTDVGEFVEVEGDAGTDLTGWTIVLYNGSNGTVYDTIILSGIIDDETGGQGARAFFEAGIQNGAPDGLALVDAGGTLIEFLSYEGSFTAVGGAADGVLSTDVGVSEPSTTPIGQSLQLLNGVWTGPAAESPGNLNTGPVVVVPIHDVQGSGTDSPLEDQPVTIEGIVVGDFQAIATNDPTDEPLDGFFVQEEDADADTDPATSEGIFVYAPGGTDVSVGDHVLVSGTVDEFFGLTEISTVTNITIVSSGNPLPAPATPTLPTAVGDPVLDWEAIEGMSVSFGQTLHVTGTFPLGSFGEVQLSATGPQDHPNQTQAIGSQAGIDQRQLNLDSRVILDDGEDENESFPSGLDSWNPNPTPYLQQPEGTLRTGDTVTDLFGVVHYSFGEYEVQPVNVDDPLDPDGAVDITRVVPRPGVPEVGGTLRVASFNVLNYFTTLGSRGAGSQAEFDIQAAKIVDAIVDLDADIVGLIEIENNAGVAVADLVSRLNDAGSRSYDYVNTGYVGTDAITVALIYDASTVVPSGGFAVLDSSISPAFIDDKNRPALAQTFEQFATRATLTVAVNHLKSKGSDCLDVANPGDPAFGVAGYAAGDDIDDPNFQGNCNLTRTAAAKVLGQWIASSPTGTSSENLLILGDLNAYANEDPIAELDAQGYTDLNELFSGGNAWADGAHSYVFDGELGTLDYGMANAALLEQVTGAEAWHINADEPPAIDYQDFNNQDQVTLDKFRSSDHDPIVVGLNLATPTTLTCNGLLATIVGSGVVYGTVHDDVIVTLGADDTIYAGNGQDTICAGAGADTVYGENGIDTIFGESGGDTIHGDRDNDVLSGGGGNDWLHGGRGDDLMSGDEGDDDLFGDRGDDALDGGAGTDLGDGGNGSDSCVNIENAVSCEL